MTLAWAPAVALDPAGPTSPYADWDRAFVAPTRPDEAAGGPPHLPAAALSPARAATAFAGLAPAAGAVSAVIDDALPFAHQRLRLADGRSRVAFAWAMGAPPGPGATDLPFGRGLDGAAVDALLAAHAARDGVDEAGVYRAAGLLDLSRPEPHSAALRASHGAGVADLAAGRDPADPLAARNPAMLVSLPSRVTHDTSGAFLSDYLCAGLAAILDRADRLAALAGRAAPYPLALTVGYGLTAGGKDGLDAFDACVSAAQAGRGAPLAVLTPAGNANLSRSHARLEGASPAGLAWRLPPDDTTPSFLEVWGPPRARPAAPSFALALSDPLGRAIGAPVFGGFDAAADLRDAAGAVLGRAYMQWRPGACGGDGRERLTLAMRPTLADRPGRPTAQPGDWGLRLVAGPHVVYPLDLHVQRDDALPGYRRRGRQSLLVDPGYRRLDDAGRAVTTDPTPPAAVRRAGAHNALGCAAGALQVGALRLGDGAPADYTATGFAPPARPRPDVWMAVDRSRARPDRMAAGTLSGSRALVAGASFAAPALARALVEGWLAAGA